MTDNPDRRRCGTSYDCHVPPRPTAATERRDLGACGQARVLSHIKMGNIETIVCMRELTVEYRSSCCICYGQQIVNNRFLALRRPNLFRHVNIASSNSGFFVRDRSSWLDHSLKQTIGFTSSDSTADDQFLLLVILMRAPLSLRSS